MRLRQLFTGELTWRELGVYIRGLPPTSRLRVAMAGGTPQWTLSEHLLAGAVDLLAAANWQRGNSGRPRHEQSRPPKQLPRPTAPTEPGSAAPEREAARQAALARAHAHRQAVSAAEST